MDFQLNLTTETIQQTLFADPLCVVPETSLRDVLHVLKEQSRGCVLVCRDQRLVGIFTERDALSLMAHGADLQQPIEAVMIPDPVCVTSTTPVGEAIAKMAEGGYRRLPVVDAQHRPLGIVKVSGILHYLVEHFPKVVYTLPPTPQVAQKREGA